MYSHYDFNRYLIDIYEYYFSSKKLGDLQVISVLIIIIIKYQCFVNIVLHFIRASITHRLFLTLMKRIAHETLAFKYRDTKITRNFLEHLPSISIQEPGEVH